MAKKKKTKSKRTTSKIATTRRAKKSSRNKQSQPSKKTAKKKQSTKKISSKTALPKKRKGSRRAAQLESPWAEERAATNRQSSDFEGLSRAEQADSESVDELVEEGNVFEAGAVAGVEAADDEDTKEVRTHEVLEDDVPDEYLDKD
jgi:hypothetical protein